MEKALAYLDGKRLSSRLLWILLLIMFVLLGSKFSASVVSENLYKLHMFQIWVGQEIVESVSSDALEDGIPDGWSAHWWSGATQVYSLEEQAVYQGKRSVRIRRTNKLGGATLTQDITVEPNNQLFVIVHSRGGKSALHFWFRERGSNEWLRDVFELHDIPPSQGWERTRLELTVPPDVNQAKLLLRSYEDSMFDEIYVGVRSNGSFDVNLLTNAGFEQDGFASNPLEWWEQVSVSSTPTVLVDINENQLSYRNISDMLAKRYDDIRQRAQALGKRCVAAPEMTAWLIALDDRFEQVGGESARERLYQLAVELAPNCPQPYAALARLYWENRGSWRAAEMYHIAAQLSGGTFQAGKYYFEEGLLHLENTGDLERAIFALERAKKFKGWERSNRLQGAASFFLGKAFETAGQFEDAMRIYKQVIDCRECFVYGDTARERLDILLDSELER